ncbi:hypothetical protein [Salibacterium lacus]|uniref:Uncharacterized protein n=1 Tax=Salibacterium lacus TaxID=1898109 RepID=A0ABW5SXY0_9BACI
MKYEAFAMVTLPTSFTVEEENREQALQKAQEKINEFVVQKVDMQLCTVNDEVITPDTIHDHTIDIADVFPEEDGDNEE